MTNREKLTDAMNSVKGVEGFLRRHGADLYADILSDVLDTLASLQEQDSTTFETDGHHVRCTNCGEYWCKTDIEGNRFPDRFCPNCGRRVK